MGFLDACSLVGSQVASQGKGELKLRMKFPLPAKDSLVKPQLAATSSCFLNFFISFEAGWMASYLHPLAPARGVI